MDFSNIDPEILLDPKLLSYMLESDDPELKAVIHQLVGGSICGKTKRIEKEKEKDKETEEKPLKPIYFSTYIRQILNQNSMFVDLINEFLGNGSYMEPEELKINVSVLFEEISRKSLDVILNTKNIDKLIKDEIVPTIEHITKNIVDIINCQYKINNFFLENFPEMNLDLVKPCYYNSGLYQMSCMLGFNEFYKFYFNNFCNQPNVNIRPEEHDQRYLNYTYNINNSKFEIQTIYKPTEDIHDPNYIDTPFVMSYNNSIINFEVLNHGYLYRIVTESSRKGNRFTFFQLTYLMYKSSAHACFIVFDTLYRKVYLLDPNGTTNYLTKYITGIDPNESYTPNISLPYIIDIFNNYVSIFNEYNNVKFKFDHQQNITLNVANEYSYNYDNGHCQTLVLLIIYLLYVHQDKLSDNIMDDMHTRFSNMSDLEMNIMKYSFSANLVKLGKDNQIITKKNFGKWFQ